MDHDNPMTGLMEAINAHDPDRIASCFTEDFRSEIPLHPAQSFEGNSHVVENWTRILAHTPDLRAEILRSASQDGLVWSEWEMRGTSVQGGPTLIRGVAICEFRDELISWNRFYLDPVVDAGRPA